MFDRNVPRPPKRDGRRKETSRLGLDNVSPACLSRPNGMAEELHSYGHCLLVIEFDIISW